MARGRRTPRRGVAGKTLDRQVAAILAGGSWLEASNVTTSGGNLTALVDKLDPTHLVSVSAGTVAAPAANAAYGGFPTFSLTGTQWLDSNRSANYWKNLHIDGECTVVFTPQTGATVVLLATRTALGVGFQFYWSGTAPHYATANGASVAMDRTAATGITVGTPTYFTGYYAETAAPESALYNKSTLADSGASTLPPNPADAQGALRIGAQLSGANPVVADVAMVLFSTRVLSSSERGVLRNYIRSKTGL